MGYRWQLAPQQVRAGGVRQLHAYRVAGLFFMGYLVSTRDQMHRSHVDWAGSVQSQCRDDLSISFF